MYLFSKPPVRLYNVFVPRRLSDEELLQCLEFPRQHIKPNAPSECLSLKNMGLLSLQSLKETELD